MSLQKLSADVERALFAFPGLSLSVAIADTTGATTRTSGPPAAARPYSPPALRRRFERVMASAHAGAVIAVTVEGDLAFEIAAPGGAFDARDVSAPPRTAGPTSPAVDVRAVAPGDLVEGESRGLYVGTTGDVAVRMAGGGSATFAAVPAATLMPIQVAEILPATTAGGLVALY